MARPDKNSSIKPFFDDSAEGINQLPAFLTAPKNPNILEKVVEEGVFKDCWMTTAVSTPMPLSTSS